MKDFNSEFYSKAENQKEQEVAFEVMKIPEIVIQEERGTQLFSLLLKAENPKWGETETSLVKETAQFFKDNPLSLDILETIREFHKQGVDEETLYNFALTYQHPERVEKVFEMAEKYKPHVKKPKEIYQRFAAILEKIDQTFSVSPLADKFATKLEQDKNERLKRMEEIRKRVEALIDFFRPDSKTTDVKKLNFVQTDPLYKPNSGRNFSAFPHEQIIISHIDNILNQDHEFLHGIINPIVEKLSEILTDEQKKKISQFASEKLKQDYGDEYFSLLCEEFIRTYTEIFSKGKTPQDYKTYEDFAQRISGDKEDEFQKELKESETFQKRCDELEIKTSEDLKNKSREFFERFGLEKSHLRDLIYEFYREYSNRSDKETENFEKFVLVKFPLRV